MGHELRLDRLPRRSVQGGAHSQCKGEREERVGSHEAREVEQGKCTRSQQHERLSRDQEATAVQKVREGPSDDAEEHDR